MLTAKFMNGKQMQNYLHEQHINNDYIISINCLKNVLGQTIGYEVKYWR